MSWIAKVSSRLTGGLIAPADPNSFSTTDLVFAYICFTSSRKGST
jgi:hypothetical protein